MHKKDFYSITCILFITFKKEKKRKISIFPLVKKAAIYTQTDRVGGLEVGFQLLKMSEIYTILL